jgi:GTP-binding protein
MLEEFTKDVRHELIFANWAPVVYISALKKKGINELLETIYDISHSSNVRIPSSELNRLISEANYDRPASRRGRVLKIYYGSQVNVCPPTILFFVNNSELMHFSTVRYFENRLREQFPLEGTPIRIKIKQSSGREDAESRAEKRKK